MFKNPRNITIQVIEIRVTSFNIYTNSWVYIIYMYMYIYIIYYIYYIYYIYTCIHENNVPSWLSPQWPCDNSSTWAHDSCAQVHELPQGHCGDNWEGILFSWLHVYYCTLLAFVRFEHSVCRGRYSFKKQLLPVLR